MNFVLSRIHHQFRSYFQLKVRSVGFLFNLFDLKSESPFPMPRIRVLTQKNRIRISNISHLLYPQFTHNISE